MEISSTSIHKFVFPFMGEGMVTFNVAAVTQQDAAVLLKTWMNQAQLELAMAFPEVSPDTVKPNEFNQMQIGLLDDLAKSCGKKENEALTAFVEKKTKLPMTVANFKKIVPMLEGIRDGNIPNG